MFDAKKPEDVQAMLLHIAAASVAAPAGRPRLARLLRAALALVEDTEPQAPPAAITPAVADALEGIHDGLATMADHAAHLATHARVIAPPRQPEA